MKFDELILSKIIKTVATRCQILRLKFTKFDLGWALPQTPLGEPSALPRGPSESFAVVCTLVHCNCFVSILFAMPIPDTFALDVGKSDSSICVNIVVQTSVFWLRKALHRRHNFSVSVALLASPQPVNSLRKRVKLASDWGSAPDPARGAS